MLNRQKVKQELSLIFFIFLLVINPFLPVQHEDQVGRYKFLWWHWWPELHTSQCPEKGNKTTKNNKYCRNKYFTYSIHTFVSQLALHVAVMFKQPPFQLGLMFTISTHELQPGFLHTINSASSMGRNTITLRHLIGSSESARTCMIFI